MISIIFWILWGDLSSTKMNQCTVVVTVYVIEFPASGHVMTADSMTTTQKTQKNRQIIQKNQISYLSKNQQLILLKGNIKQNLTSTTPSCKGNRRVKNNSHK